MTITGTSDGRQVGIGTTSPLSKLHIEESTNDADALMIRQTAGGSGSVQGKVHIGMNHFNSTNPSVRITAEELDVADFRGNLAFSTRAATSDVAPTEKMRITHDGNVGIGTTSPAVDLHILDASSHAQLRVETDSASHGAYLELESTTNKYQIYNLGGNLGIDEAGVATRFSINSSGNVLIGGTSASGHGFNLEVLNDHAYVKGPDGWDGSGDKAIVALGSGVSNESFGCGYVHSTGLVLSSYKLSGGGHFGSSTQNSLIIADTTGQASFINDVVAFASSDIRLKENVKPLDNALDKINKINGVEFDWIDGKDEHGNSVHGNEGHDVGVIAQEIEEVLPEVVQTRDNGYKAVKYEKIVPLLIEAIKEQQKQIEELKNG